MRIVLEPQARYIGDMLNTIGETITFIETFKTKSLAFEADLHQDVDGPVADPDRYARGACVKSGACAWNRPPAESRRRT